MVPCHVARGALRRCTKVFVHYITAFTPIARRMNFVRGASSDTAEKGERYGWSRPVPAASRGRKRPHDDESDEDAYFDKDEEPQHSRVAAPTPEEDPLDAFMAELHGRNARTAPQTDDPAAPAATRPATAGAVKPCDAAPPPPLTADDLEEDPLDAFMAGLASAPSQPKGRERAVQQCDEEEDPVASYLEESGLRAAEAEAEAEAGAPSARSCFRWTTRPLSTMHLSASSTLHTRRSVS
jgi:hypothetical protein